jgi:hypothetical protein
MRSSRKSETDEAESEIDGILVRISKELAREETQPELRIARLETLLRLTAEVLSTYGMNIYTLATHQVQLVRQIADLESVLTEMSRSKSPPLPAARPKSDKDDYN